MLEPTKLSPISTGVGDLQLNKSALYDFQIFWISSWLVTDFHSVVIYM